MQEFLEIVRTELAKHPGQYMFGAFFLWGLTLSLFATVANLFTASLYLLVLHSLTAGVFYIGFFRNKEGGGNILGLVTGSVMALFTLTIDVLLVL